MLTLDRVTKGYMRKGNEVLALDDVSLDIERGEFVSIVGPSGSGKSTLLLLFGGMLSPTQGKVLFEGRSIYDLDAESRASLRKLKIGFVFQTFNLVPYLTARENVQVPLFLAGMEPVAQIVRAAELLERVGLGARMDHTPPELSIGQQQRVALARMLANEPDLILADEPTGNLDPETSASVIDFLAELHAEGRTIVMVTHDPSVARRAHRTLRIVEGRIEEDRVREPLHVVG